MFQSQSQYKKLKVLVQGDFGQMALVQDLAKLDKVYVVKIFNLDYISDQGKTDEEGERYVKRTLEKAKLMKTINHPNIVKVFGTFQQGSQLHVVTEYWDSSETLKDAICDQKKGELFPEETVCRWIAQLSMALHFLHEKKMLHRDVKPDNVYLTQNRQKVKLGDCGISQTIKEGTGTVTYSAPEIWQNGSYSFKSEVWALGIVAYEVMALELPFQFPEGANIIVLGRIICSYPIKQLPESKYSAELRRLVIKKLLERDVAKRPNMSDVLCDCCIVRAIVSSII